MRLTAASAGGQTVSTAARYSCSIILLQRPDDAAHPKSDAKKQRK